MAKDVAEMMRDTLSQAVRDAAHTFGDGNKSRGNGSLSGMKGVAAGAGLAALAPLAAKGAGKAVKRRLAGQGAKSAVKSPAKKVKDATSKVGDSVGKGVGEKVKEKVDESGGVGGIAKEAGKSVLPFGGGDESGGKGGVAGVGKGRRMPVQQSMDVAVPIETAYNQWTQFEEWPDFMHRVTRVTQEDDCTVSFASKMWGITKEFKAEIQTQRPDERIKWRVAQGITHTGVVTFHELAPRLTRIELSVDVDPGSLLEKAARGMRHIKRAMRADLHRFKAYIEMQEMETGAWRGVIEDGEVVQEHDDSYDEERDYHEGEEDAPEAEGDAEAEADAEEPEEEEQEEEQEESQQERSERFARQAEGSSSKARRSRGGNGRSRSGGGRSRSGSGGGRKKAESRS
jgi:uncharacterized membrane protein/ribosomal protein S20